MKSTISNKLSYFEKGLYVLIGIAIVSILELNAIIHFPVPRYILSLLFLYYFLQFVISNKRKYDLRRIVIVIVSLSILTFVRGINGDLFIMKHYFSSTFSHYFFPLVLLVSIDLRSLFRFLNKLIYFQTLLLILVLINFRYWLEDAFLFDNISRILMSISGILFLVLAPYYKSQRLLLTINIVLSMLINVLIARRAETIFLVQLFVLGITLMTKSNVLRLVNLIFLLALFYLMAVGTAVTDKFQDRLDTKFENRGNLFEEVTSDLESTNSWLLGKGASGTYRSKSITGDWSQRIVIENGYYNMVLKSGVLYLLLFLILVLIAIYRGLFKSNNRFSKSLSFFLIVYLTLMVGHGVFEFSFRTLFVWFAIALNLNRDIIKLKDGEIDFLVKAASKVKIQNSKMSEI